MIAAAPPYTRTAPPPESEVLPLKRLFRIVKLMLEGKVEIAPPPFSDLLSAKVAFSIMSSAPCDRIAPPSCAELPAIRVKSLIVNLPPMMLKIGKRLSPLIVCPLPSIVIVPLISGKGSLRVMSSVKLMMSWLVPAGQPPTAVFVLAARI